MTFNALAQLVFYSVALLACVKPLGLYMARVYAGNAPYPARMLVPMERLLYRLGGIEPNREMSARQYGTALLLFSMVSFVAVYVIQRVQGYLAVQSGVAAGRVI